MFKDSLNVIFGIVGLFGLGLSIALFASSYSENGAPNSGEIFFALSLSIVFLSITLVAAYFYYLKELRKLNDLPSLNDGLVKDNIHYEVLLNSSAEILHNITHYYRNTLYIFDRILDQNDNPEDKLDDAINYFYSFINTFTSNVQSYFSAYTKDKCAVTVKLVKGDVVKTFYRDSISYRSRKKNDIDSQGNIKLSKINENSDFYSIMNKDLKETTFLCNNLQSHESYFNSNSDYLKYYNACAVVPISRNSRNNILHVIGFLCVDNFKGRFTNQHVENFLCGLSDSLYNLFLKYEQIINLTDSKGISNEKITKFLYWG